MNYGNFFKKKKFKKVMIKNIFKYKFISLLMIIDHRIRIVNVFSLNLKQFRRNTSEIPTISILRNISLLIK